MCEMSKSKLREHAKNIRSCIDNVRVSLAIVEKIKLLPEYQAANNIVTYYPYSSELNLLGLLKDESKNWFLPRVSGNFLDICFYQSSSLVENRWGILEPCPSCDKVSEEILDMVILPGLCADKSLHRLGYGKGFYDRLIKNLPVGCVTVFPVIDELLISEIPKDEWDEPVDIIITEKKYLYNKNA